MSKIAAFPGSFSPFTIGHQGVIESALPLFEKIIIAIGVNQEKEEYFSINKRLNWINEVYQKNPKIEVQKYEGLTIDFCNKINAQFIIRGLRSSIDFEFEKNIVQTNKKLNQNIETIFFVSKAEHSHISSSILRDIIKHGGDVSNFIPKQINL